MTCRRFIGAFAWMLYLPFNNRSERERACLQTQCLSFVVWHTTAHHGEVHARVVIVINPKFLDATKTKNYTHTSYVIRVISLLFMIHINTQKKSASVVVIVVVVVVVVGRWFLVQALRPTRTPTSVVMSPLPSPEAGDATAAELLVGDTSVKGDCQCEKIDVSTNVSGSHLQAPQFLQ